MNSFKLIILLAALSILLISCGQAPTASNVKNTNITRTAENVAVSANADGTTKTLRTVRSDQVAETVDGDDKVIDLYSEKCMACHKDGGKGGKMTIEGKTIKPADLTSAKIKAKSDDKLLAEIKEGVPDEGMPSFAGKLSDDEIKSIIQKIRKF